MHRLSPSFLVLVSLLALGGGACSHASASEHGAPTAAAAAPVAPNEPVYRVALDGLPSIGSAGALVTIVSFTDYECPYCQRAEETMTRLRAAYGDDLRILVAEAPLPMHEHAKPAALAALVADAQGRFEGMHANLFAAKGALDDHAIDAASRAAGLSLQRADTDRAAAAASLARAQALAASLGVSGTPTFFVGGRRVVGAQPYEVFQGVVEERLAAARALVKSGVRPGDVYAELVKNGASSVPSDAKPLGGSCGGGDCHGNGGSGAEIGDKVEPVPTEGAPARGSSHAAITVVAFSDFECPFSAKSEATLRALETAHPGDVRLVFKNRPLPMHATARLAAKGALAADAQGRFWEFHDRLFARAERSVDRAALDGIASDLGLDLARFSRDLADPALDGRIARDEADAEALEIEGTPTFFVNGRRVVGAQGLSVFEAAIAKSAAK